MTDDLRKRALTHIAREADPARLRKIAANAAISKEAEVEEAALRKLYDVQPSAQPGTLEYDVWRSIYALEGSLSVERGKTTRLARTRQKISRDGELKTVQDLILGKASDGFRMLIERNWPDLTFEAVALRHPDIFENSVKTAATERLMQAGVDMHKLQPGS